MRVTGVIRRYAVIGPLELWTSVFMDSVLDGMCERSGYLGLSWFSVVWIDLLCNPLKVATPWGHTKPRRSLLVFQ